MSVDPNYYFNTGGQGGLTGGQRGLNSGLGRCGLGGANQNTGGNFNSSDSNQFLGYSSMLNQHSLQSLSDNLDHQSINQQYIHSLADSHPQQTTAYNQEMFTGAYRENSDLVYKSPANHPQNYQENFNLYNNLNTNTCQTMSSNVDNFAGGSIPLSNTSYLSPSRNTMPFVGNPVKQQPSFGNYDRPCIEMPNQMNPDIDHTLPNDFRHSNTAAADAGLWPQTASPQPSSWQQAADNRQQLIGSPSTWPNVPCVGQTNVNSDVNWKQMANEQSVTGLQQSQHGGLELLYRETDRLIRNRSNSMTDVLLNKPADQIIPNRNFELLEQHFTSLRLEENFAPNQDYTLRRGSGTFQRPGAAKGLDFGGRRRFPSMDPALFSSRGNTHLPAPNVGSHQESILSSLLSESTSPILSQMESIWSPLVKPSRSISPIDSSGSEILPIEEFVFQSDDDDENSLFGKSNKVKTSQPKKREKSASVSIQAPNVADNVMPKKETKGKKSVSESEFCGTASTLAAASWSQIVRTKPSPAQGVRKNHNSAQQSFANSPPLKPLSSSSSPCSTPSPINLPASATYLPAVPATNNTFNQQPPTADNSVMYHNKAANEYHRGPKVDSRWPVENQVFLGPIPVAVTWEVIRNTFYEKVERHHILHTYVQSKPVNDVVYGQIVFDKPAITSKILKEGAIKVGGHVISVTAMKDKVKPAERKR